MLRAAALGALLAAACSCAATSTACATAHYPGAMMNNPLLDVDQNQFTSRSAGPSNPNLKHMAFWDDVRKLRSFARHAPRTVSSRPNTRLCL